MEDLKVRIGCARLVLLSLKNSGSPAYSCASKTQAAAVQHLLDKDGSRLSAEHSSQADAGLRKPVPFHVFK
jgi:hypothetical protein